MNRRSNLCPLCIASVAHSVGENPGLSIPRRSLELGISQTTLHRILWSKLGDMDVDDVYFQQDSALCHISGETIGLLREKSFQAEWFLETAITIGRRDHAI